MIVINYDSLISPHFDLSDFQINQTELSAPETHISKYFKSGVGRVFKMAKRRKACKRLVKKIHTREN